MKLFRNLFDLRANSNYLETSIEAFFIMGAKEVFFDQVPGFKVVQQIIASIDRDVLMINAAYNFDQENYHLNLTCRGRKGHAVLSRNLLNDICDDKGTSGIKYNRELLSKLTLALREAVDKMS